MICKSCHHTILRWFKGVCGRCTYQDYNVKNVGYRRHEIAKKRIQQLAAQLFYVRRLLVCIGSLKLSSKADVASVILTKQVNKEYTKGD